MIFCSPFESIRKQEDWVVHLAEGVQMNKSFNQFERPGKNENVTFHQFGTPGKFEAKKLVIPPWPSEFGQQIVGCRSHTIAFLGSRACCVFWSF